MKRRVFVGVVLTCLSLSAGAEEPVRERAAAIQALPAKEATLQNSRQKEPDTILVAVPSRVKGAVDVYLYDRASRVAVLVPPTNTAANRSLKKPLSPSPQGLNPESKSDPDCDSTVGTACVMSPGKIKVSTSGYPGGVPEWARTREFRTEAFSVLTAISNRISKDAPNSGLSNATRNPSSFNQTGLEGRAVSPAVIQQ